MADTLLAQIKTQAERASVKADKTPEPTIEIHGALRHLTALYERLRGFVDYQEERFIRRLAIRRILFRVLVIEGATTPIGERLIRELIRAAYLENARYPVRIAGAIDAYLKPFRTALPVLESRYSAPELLRMQRRLLGLSAAGIEELIEASDLDRLLTARLETEIAGYLDKEIDDEIRMIALRALWKADAELIADYLLATSQKELAKAFEDAPTKRVGEVLQLIIKADLALRDRRIEAAVRRFGRLVPPYLVIADLTEENAEELDHYAHDHERLRRGLEDRVRARLASSETRLRRAIIRTTIYIFLTKIIVGIALEIPYDLATLGHIAFLPLGINLLIPPLLMIAAGLGIRTPSSANTNLVVDRARRILLGEDLAPLPAVERAERRRPAAASLLFFVFYLATYVVSFGGLIWLLNVLQFNLASIVIFLFFLSVVGFFAFRIRGSARELQMVREREPLVFLVFDFFALPFLRVGRFLSVTVRQLNVILFVLDFLIEAPLKIVLVALEDWFAFLREKREELS